MQSAKIIDVTRSYIPVDPNAFPETLHGTEKEDYPEKRFPVVPYIGHNFLPTAAGYKSYFGLNSTLGINSLSPNKAQHLFIFQTLTYKNIFVALCDTGIWFKDGSTSGAWSQAVALDAIADNAYYEWTFTIIKSTLFAFRNNGTHYYKIYTDGSSPIGASLDSLVPTFITITSQLGIFRLGARLAFWDGQNAIAWCNPDDLTDFTPAVLTGANVTTFNSVTGKISAIRTHGRHAICYATKSITLLEVAPAETFFVKASPILSECGVAYLNQSVAASPDTAHFAYTDAGIYKIENGAPELIVPEVYDYFKKYTSKPVYLELLQGRYLCFEALDPRLIDGSAQFSTVVLPPDTITFQGGDDTDAGTLEVVHSLDPTKADVCDIIKKLDKQQYTEQKTAATGAVPPDHTFPGSTPVAIYKCYISEANGPVEIKDWGSVPCGGTKWDGTFYKPSPITNAGKLSTWTTDSSNKTAKDGRDVWTDGRWTMERFVQYQSAIWDKQQAGMAEFIGSIAGRSEGSESITSIDATCAVGIPVDNDCTIGRYPTKFSPFQFGFNKCSFWLTRYALGAADVINHFHKATACATVWTGAFTNEHQISGSVVASTITGTVTYYTTTFAPLPVLTGDVDGPTYVDTTIYLNSLAGPVAIFRRDKVFETHKTLTSSSANREAPLPDGVLGVETAYCELIGYQYLDTDGNKQFAAVTACTQTADKYPGAPADTGTRQVPSDANRPPLTDPETGAMCGIPYTTPDTDTNDSNNAPLTWPDQTVNYPPVSFLLQDGSIAPVYPTKYGAFVYDLHLKKWGKFKAEYKRLLDYSPINGSEGSTVSFDIFGILAGVFKDDGYIYLFDTKPTDSILTWGKIGYYRAGMTDCQEVRFDFDMSDSQGTVTVDVSMDGKNVAVDLSYSEDFAGDTVTVYPPYSGKWFNISLSGNWDVSFIEFKGYMKGRR